MGLRGPQPRAFRSLAKGNGKAPKMPKHLDAEGKQTWRALVKSLREMGLLGDTDVALMTLYCDTWGEYLKARQMVAKTGDVLANKVKGTMYMSPYVALEAMYKNQLIKCLQELGLSPRSRAALHVDNGGVKHNPLSEFGIVG